MSSATPADYAYFAKRVKRRRLRGATNLTGMPELRLGEGRVRLTDFAHVPEWFDPEADFDITVEAGIITFTVTPDGWLYSGAFPDHGGPAMLTQGDHSADMIYTNAKLGR